jgi:hypothetical protein
MSQSGEEKKEEEKIMIYFVTDDEEDVMKDFKMTLKERASRPLRWKLCNAEHLMKKAEKRVEMGKSLTMHSRDSFKSYGKTWHFSFSPVTGVFKFYFLEEDDNFFATFTVEVGETIFEQKIPLKFDRGVSCGVRLNNTSGTRQDSRELIEITSQSIIENDVWKFIVTIFPTNSC